MDIWTRKFELEVKYDCFEDEELLSAQEESISKIIKCEVIDESLVEVKKYITSNDEDKISEKTIDNIFKYVIPNKLYAMRDGKDRTIALLCDYIFDPEHGIAIIFKNEKFVRIGIQDIVF